MNNSNPWQHFSNLNCMVLVSLVTHCWQSACGSLSKGSFLKPWWQTTHPPPPPKHVWIPYLLPHRWPRSTSTSPSGWRERAGWQTQGHVTSPPLIWKRITFALFFSQACATEHSTHLLAIRPKLQSRNGIPLHSTNSVAPGGLYKRGRAWGTHTNKRTKAGPENT